MATDWEDDDDVGFGRPPRWSRFRKGQSGNPQGRPRKAPKAAAIPADSDADRLFRQELDRTVTITEAGKARKVPMSEVVTRSIFNKAAQGNVLAQREILKSQRELEQREHERAEAAAMEETNRREQIYSGILRIKEEQRDAWQQAVARGLGEPEQPWPHPDDILIDDRNLRFRIRGPFDDSTLPHFEQIRALRDALFLELAIAMRKPGREGRRERKFKLMLMSMHDILLPLRWQIGADAVPILAVLCQTPLRTLRWQAEYSRGRAALSAPPGHGLRDKECYTFVNRVMAPILKPLGYSSLARFERAFDASEEKAPPSGPGQKR